MAFNVAVKSAQGDGCGEESDNICQFCAVLGAIGVLLLI